MKEIRTIIREALQEQDDRPKTGIEGLRALNLQSKDNKWDKSFPTEFKYKDCITIRRSGNPWEDYQFSIKNHPMHYWTQGDYLVSNYHDANALSSIHLGGKTVEQICEEIIVELYKLSMKFSFYGCR